MGSSIFARHALCFALRPPAGRDSRGGDGWDGCITAHWRVRSRTDSLSTFHYPENGTFPMKKRTLQAISSNPLDYPGSMSGYERESLVAEAKLASEKKKLKTTNSGQKRAAVDRAMSKTR